MPTETLEPNSCDKTITGMNACGSCSAAAETCNCTTASGCSSGSVEKSGAEFFNFDAASYQAYWTAATLKVDWKLWKLTGDDSGSCDQNKLYLQYNLGSGWNNFSGFPKSATGSNQTGTATKALGLSQNMANVKVRAYALAECCTPCAPTATDRCCENIEGREFCWCVEDCATDCPFGDCEYGGC